MDNLMPGDNSGPGGPFDRGHYDDCRVNCIYELEDFGGGDIECVEGHHTHECDCEDIFDDRDEW